MNASDADLVERLEQAIADLQWMSESDYPFTVVYWQEKEPLTLERLLQLTDHPLEAIVETVAVDAFFAVATHPQDWHDAEAAAIVHRYQALVETLKQSLHALMVYQIGEINLDLYVIGTSESGAFIGVATKAVET